MATPTTPPKRITDIGPPHYEMFLPPIVKQNYGQWQYHENLAPGVLCHVARSGDRLYTVRAGSPRLLSVQTLRKIAELADRFSDGYLRFTSRHNVEYLLTDPGEDRAAEAGPRRARAAGGRHEQRHQQHRPHAGLGALSFVGDRCVRYRQGRDGHAVRSVHAGDPAGEAAHRDGLLPEHVRRRALLRHRHPRHPPAPAEDQPRDAAADLRGADARSRPARRARFARRRSTARRRWKWSSSSACTAATATPCARRCRSTIRRTTGCRSGSAGR